MIASPVGLLFLAGSDRGVCHLEFMDRKSLKRVIAGHSPLHPGATWTPSLLELKPVVDQVEAYFNGGLVDFDVKLAPIGTDAQLKVWKALRAIPYGETVTYGDLAKRLKQPRAARAITLVAQQNPIALIVPCHRAVGAAGSLAGYPGGVTRRRWLLEHESAHRKRLESVGEEFVAAAGATRRTRR
ncbi:MAG: methylated-DNA--[protein]-cysteine S-methyltransferase [Candidatus Eisenbacteria bacterium]|uniref:methylated-DNA--[protein]-cysteine S-methyltransferase n=1 Tax=Eiseniibacteriota bacterium TaxID=2212470 RepID=A0A849SIA3_UNCEI|nr:methylated-DNA--[protein]-cysteine S-methyltransferase [Candidatus Eisenbacteria bacterium]